MADAEVYTRCMLSQRHGYPLWNPNPFNNLPAKYRKRGVWIGDLGIITADGGFDFLFNISIAASHPINKGRTPPNFEPVAITVDDIRTELGWRRAGDNICNVGIKKEAASGGVSAPVSP
jgi:hypothetical protein